MGEHRIPRDKPRGDSWKSRSPSAEAVEKTLARRRNIARRRALRWIRSRRAKLESRYGVLPPRHILEALNEVSRPA